MELFRQCWFLFSILFIGFWNCSDSVGFCFPFYLLAFGTVPTNFPFYLLAFGTVPTVLVFVFHFIYWLLELFRQCWIFHFIYWLLELFRHCRFSILFIGFWKFHKFSNLLAFGTVPKMVFKFIGFWNCSDSVGFCFPFYLTVGTVPTKFSILFIGFWNCSDKWIFHFIYWLLELFRHIFHFIYWLLELFRHFPVFWNCSDSFPFIGFWNCSDSVGFCFPFYLLAFGTVPTWFLFSILFIGFWKNLLELFRLSDCSDSFPFIGFWNCSDSCGFYFPIYWLLENQTVPTVLVFIFHFF